MQRPWIAENAVELELARTLIAEAFPDLADARVEPFGVGWDNTAFTAVEAGGSEWVFRFPRRTLAVDAMRAEVACLPGIAGRLPLSIPVPSRVGQPGARYPWPFAGYLRLPGRTACDAALDGAARGRAAVPIARFLAALHAIPRAEAVSLGFGPDTIGRLDLARRTGQVQDWLRSATDQGLIQGAGPWESIVTDLPSGWRAAAETPVHGDLYSRHVLVDDAGMPSGVIDWGDVHLGDPAIDLSIAHGLLPRRAHDAFRDAYGPIADDTWRVARFKALQSALATAVYGHDVGDKRLVAESLVALAHLAGR